MLAAGLEGIINRYEIPSPLNANVFEMTDSERANLGISTLPRNLGEAVAITEQSDLVRKALGSHVFESFIHNKKLEWEKYNTLVTDHEIRENLPVL